MVGVGVRVGKMKSCSLCITSIRVKHPQAKVIQPVTQQTQSFSNPIFPLTSPMLLPAPQIGAAPRGNRHGETRSFFGVSFAPGAPLTGQRAPRCERRISPRAMCQVEQLAYFSFRSLSALPKRGGGEKIRARVSCSRISSPFYMVILLHAANISQPL